MRKLVITGTLLLCISLLGHAQKKVDLSTADPYVLELTTEIDTASGRLPFREIIIKDYRFDTTKYGYIRLKGIRKMVFASNSSAGFTSLINHYYKARLDSTSGQTLVIILKTFWLQQGTEGLYSDEKLQERGTVKWPHETTGSLKAAACYTSMDLFVGESNSYRALLRLEDEFAGGRFRSRHLKGLFFEPFDSAMRSIARMDIPKTIAAKKKFTMAEIEANYMSRFNVTVLKSNPSSRGVFLTFDDFKSNRVSYPEFVTREGSLTDQLYIGKTGEQLLVDYWGFFDGKDFYIHIGLNFFKMVRQNNTFDLWGAKNVSRRTNVYDSDPRSSLVTQTTRVDLKPLQLDMALGEVY